MCDTPDSSGGVPPFNFKIMLEESVLSNDSEYDDFLGVPDSLDLTLDDNGQPVNVENVIEDDNDCKSM